MADVDDIEEIIKIRDIFKKCTDILNEVIKTTEKIEKTEDKVTIKKLENKIEEKLGLFTLQIIKLQSLK